MGCKAFQPSPSYEEEVPEQVERSQVVQWHRGEEESERGLAGRGLRDGGSWKDGPGVACCPGAFSNWLHLRIQCAPPYRKACSSVWWLRQTSGSGRGVIRCDIAVTVSQRTDLSFFCHWDENETKREEAQRQSTEYKAFEEVASGYVAQSTAAGPPVTRVTPNIFTVY
jgi:hypothetical protein